MQPAGYQYVDHGNLGGSEGPGAMPYARPSVFEEQARRSADKLKVAVHFLEHLAQVFELDRVVW